MNRTGLAVLRTLDPPGGACVPRWALSRAAEAAADTTRLTGDTGLPAGLTSRLAVASSNRLRTCANAAPACSAVRRRVPAPVAVAAWLFRMATAASCALAVAEWNASLVSDADPPNLPDRRLAETCASRSRAAARRRCASRTAAGRRPWFATSQPSCATRNSEGAANGDSDWGCFERW